MRLRKKELEYRHLEISKIYNKTYKKYLPNRPRLQRDG